MGSNENDSEKNQVARSVLLEAAKTQYFVKLAQFVRGSLPLAEDVQLIFPVVPKDLDWHGSQLDIAIAERRQEVEALDRRAAELRDGASRAAGSSGRAGRRQAAAVLRDAEGESCKQNTCAGAP